MSERERKQRSSAGKQKQAWTEREARRLLRAAKAEGENCILRKLPDGTLELVPMTGADDGGKQNEWDNVK